jgi:hypothetical protein
VGAQSRAAQASGAISWVSDTQYLLLSAISLLNIIGGILPSVCSVALSPMPMNLFGPLSGACHVCCGFVDCDKEDLPFLHISSGVHIVEERSRWIRSAVSMLLKHNAPRVPVQS